MRSSLLRFREKTRGNTDGGNLHLSHEGAVSSLYERPNEGITAEDQRGYYQPVIWWFTSIAFPLFASTFGPLASLLSICGLVQSWLTSKVSGAQIPDPRWLLALNVFSLVLALLANLLLLFNFAKRISYAVAQPLTIIFWYLSCIFLLVPVIITRTNLLHRHSSYALSQSYYYAFIATITYFIISTLLLFNLLGSHIFHAYPPSFAQLDRPQRTLMLQTIIFSAYLALGAAIFSAIENWDFVDGIYWADYTLLTIGLGSDFPISHTAGRMAAIPFAAVGILIIGLIVSSVRALVIERARVRITKGRLQKERKKWVQVIEKMSRGTKDEAKVAERKFTKVKERWWKQKKMNILKVKEDDLDEKRWRIREFMMMRCIEEDAKKMEDYIALGFAVFIFGVVWIGGSVVFWACQLSQQKPSPWTYPESLYFTYTSILTIGYGDFYPSTTSTRPFFVIWSFLAVPSLTVLIQNVQETFAREVQSGVEWVGRWSILPEKRSGVEEGTENKRNEEEEGGGDIRECKLPIQMLPIGRHRKRRKDKGNSGSLVEEEDTDGVPSEPHLPRPELPSRPTMISGTRQQLLGIPTLLSVRLSREITKVSRDAAKDPMIRYNWHEWVQWLKLMEEAGEMLGRCQHTGDYDGRDADLANGGDYLIPCGIHDDRHQQQPEQQCDDVTDGKTGRRIITTTTMLVDRWRWGWLDDNGPLFSSTTEVQWVLERLCRLFEGVVEKEFENCWMVGDEDEEE